MMIPPQVTLVPLFSMMRHFPLAGGNNLLGNGGSGLINTYTGLILPYIAGSFGVFMCRQYYLSFPRDLDEAAIIDGCNRFRCFYRIYLPVSKPMLASLAILKFTGFWNEYTWPLVMTLSRSDRVKTVPDRPNYLPQRGRDFLEPPDGCHAGLLLHHLSALSLSAKALYRRDPGRGASKADPPPQEPPEAAKYPYITKKMQQWLACSRCASFFRITYRPPRKDSP